MIVPVCIYCIVLLCIAGMIIRPYKSPEFVWAVSGAILLVITGLLPPASAWTGIKKGSDVYLFLIGMMLLAETARQEGLFNWLANHATRIAKGSPVRFFLLVYCVGVVVTVFLSNDATAIVLTPAVAAAARAAQVKRPVPYLLICAFVANAASFVLPISNPANLVVYGKNMPSLPEWLSTFLLPSVFAIAVTFATLFLLQRRALTHSLALHIPEYKLSAGGKLCFAGMVVIAFVLMLAAAFGWPLGLVTMACGLLIVFTVSVASRKNPAVFTRKISWAVLPLVAGLFVLVEALDQTGFIGQVSSFLRSGAQTSTGSTTFVGGILTAIATNIFNNLPAGLLIGTAVSGTPLPELVKAGMLIAIDLGPNLSVTGSLATILWMTELRKEGIEISPWKFLLLGFPVMFLALLAAFAGLWMVLS